MSNRIEFDGTGDGVVDNGVHFVGIVDSSHTMCGLTLDGDRFTCGTYKKTEKKVDCEQCILIVEYSKNIPKNQYKKLKSNGN